MFNNTDIDQSLHWDESLQRDFLNQTMASRMAAAVEDKVFKEVLRNFLKREPTLEDASKCQMIYREGEHNEWTFAFLGVSLGQFKREFKGNEYTVTFTPHV